MKKNCRFLRNVSFMCVALLCLASMAIAADTAVPAGQKLFMDKKCNTCHSIDSLKITKKLASSKAADLSNVGATRTAEWIAKWLNKEVDLEGKKHSAPFKGTPEEVKTLSEWLATLKTAAATK